MKHTPEVLEVKPVAIEFTDDSKLIGSFDVEFEAESISFPEMKEVAQIFKASPALLEACKSITDKIPELWGDHVIDGKVMMMVDADDIDRLISAVAKAEGK